MTGVDLETMYKFMLENHAESYMLFFHVLQAMFWTPRDIIPNIKSR